MAAAALAARTLQTIASPFPAPSPRLSSLSPHLTHVQLEIKRRRRCRSCSSAIAQSRQQRPHDRR